MKQALLLIPFLLFFSFCKNDAPTEAKELNEEKQEARQVIKNGKDIGKIVKPEGNEAPVHIKASPDAPFIGHWNITHAFNGKDGDVEMQNDLKGRWYILNADNTFTTGKGEVQSNSGKWSFDTEQKSMDLYPDQPSTLPVQWRVKGNSEDMLWQGNTVKNPAPWQVKLLKDLSK